MIIDVRKDLFNDDLRLTNDMIYQCSDCEEIFEVYSQSGTTNFCPNCGSRNFDELEED